MTRSTSNQGVFHDNGVLADCDSAVLGSDHSGMQDSCACVDPNIADDHSRRRNISGRMDQRFTVPVSQEHSLAPILTLTISGLTVKQCPVSRSRNVTLAPPRAQAIQG